MTGHTAPTSCVRVSPDGLTFASGSYDRSILLWDAGSGAVLRRIEGHTSLINAIDWSPDGNWIASAASDHTARIWDASTGRELCRLSGHTDDVNAVRWSADGTRIATGSFDGTVRVWTRGGHCLLVAAHHRSDVNGIEWFPDGRRIAAVSDDGTVSIFEADGGRIRRILEGHRDWVDGVAVHPDGARLASAGLDGVAIVWDARSGRRLATLADATCVVKAVAWSADGSELAVASYDGQVRVYSATTYRPVSALRGEDLWARTLCATPRGWITGSFGGGPVELTGHGLTRLGARTTRGLNGFCIGSDGDTAFACSDSGALYEIDIARRRATRRIAEHDAAVLCADVSPDMRRLVTGSWDRSVRLWDRLSGDLMAVWEGLGDPVNAVAFTASGDGVHIGTFNGDVLLWDPERAQTRRLGQHHGSVKALARLSAGVVSVGRDGKMRRFEREQSRAFRAGDTILNDVAVAPSGTRLVTASRRDGVQLWSRSGQELGRYAAHPCSARSVSFCRDESRVAMAYYDGHLGVWEPQTGAAEVRPVCEASLSRVAFRQGTLLASAWDSQGSMLFVDPQTWRVERMAVAA